jgi:O-antigen biosynthesis protein
MSPKVSIVMSTYNQDRYLWEALDSIRAQTYSDFELIVVDDGSTDDTPAILEDYRREFPFHHLVQQNSGQQKALNRAFAMASGEYWTWTSSDNNLRPNMLEVLVSELDRDLSVGLVYSDWVNIGTEGELTHHVESIEFDRLMLLRENYVHCSFLYRRSCGEAAGQYDEHVGTAFDWDYWLRMSRICSFRHVPQTLYEYRKHPASLHKQPDNHAQYVLLARKWFHQEPFNWYRSVLQRKVRLIRQGQVSLVQQLPADGKGLALDHSDRPYRPRRMP